jgi:DNA-directed RNA polymerase subunit RPC12/RpoP
MSNLETDCPVCGHKNSLQYSQNADIVYKVVNGKLVPQLNEDSIGWLDSTYLYCSKCGANEEDNEELADIKFEYDHNI